MEAGQARGQGSKIKQFDVCIVELGRTKGSEIRKSRPCVVVSPDSLNARIRTTVIAPLTSTSRDSYLWRVDSTFQGKSGQVALDQIRTVDHSRLVKRLGVLDVETCKSVSDNLVEMFRYRGNVSER